MLLLTLHSAIASRISSRQSASSSTSRIVIGSFEPPPLLSVSFPVEGAHLWPPAERLLLIAATMAFAFPSLRRAALLARAAPHSRFLRLRRPPLRRRFHQELAVDRE